MSVSVCWSAKFWTKTETENTSANRGEKHQERNLVSEHKYQSKASRCERRGRQE